MSTSESPVDGTCGLYGCTKSMVPGRGDKCPFIPQGRTIEAFIDKNDKVDDFFYVDFELLFYFKVILTGSERRAFAEGELLADWEPSWSRRNGKASTSIISSWAGKLFHLSSKAPFHQVLTRSINIELQQSQKEKMDKC